MKQPDLATDIDMSGRMMIALEEIEACREFVALIPEVRTNMVFAQPHAKTPDEVMAIDGRITIINGMPRVCRESQVRGIGPYGPADHRTHEYRSVRPGRDRFRKSCRVFRLAVSLLQEEWMDAHHD